ncbi:MAG: phosphonate ABC transporter, permease protein PhnE [Erysipelotrichaceae bacterium]|nr:phosphonate ABC transporter, permease protein PhnE [Erysipelotrichaceae bacterium]
MDLFNRVFKPRKITLNNGHVVEKPYSKNPFIVAAVLVVIFISIKVTEFNIGLLVTRIHEFTVILSQIFRPDLSYLKNVINPLIDTVKMSMLGTIIGCLLALPFAVLASSNINKNRIILSIVRFILSVVRSIPTLIIASIAALVFGLGTFAGTISIAIFTFGIVAKMLFESIEIIDMGPFEAMESMGATKIRAFQASCTPQILPTYLSHCLYCFEMNIRAASILGYVGAGGAGILINERIGWRDYYSLGTVLLSLFIMVFLIDLLSSYLRSKLS